MVFCDRLRDLMARSGVTQADLARRMGVSRSCVNNWYWGINEPSIESLRVIRRILRCSWEELMGE